MPCLLQTQYNINISTSIVSNPWSRAVAVLLSFPVLNCSLKYSFMMTKTRSQTKLRRGRRIGTRAKVALPLHQRSKKSITLNRLPRKDSFKRRNFTTNRQEIAKLFVEKANQNSKRYGTFGSDKWFSALQSEINEPEVVLLKNVRQWFDLHPEVFQNAQIAACTRMPILKQDENRSSPSSFQISDSDETLSSCEIDRHIDSHAVSKPSGDISCCNADASNGVHQLVREDEIDHGVNISLPMKKDDEHASFSSSYQISDDAETLSFEIDGHIDSDCIHAVSTQSLPCCGADAFNNVHHVLNIDLPNSAEEELIIDFNRLRLNDYEVEDLSQLAMNAATIIEPEIMHKPLEDKTGCADFPVSASGSSHNYQTGEFGRLEKQIGVDLTGTDQELLNEVLVELDKFFSGVHVDQIVKMVNDLHSTTSTASGIGTGTGFSNELPTSHEEELQIVSTEYISDSEPLVTRNSQECCLSMDVDGVRKFQFVFKSAEFSVPPKPKMSMIRNNLTNFRLVMNAFKNLAFTYENWDGFLIDKKNESICKIFNALKHEFYTIEKRQLKTIASSKPSK